MIEAGPRHYCTYFDSNYLPQGLALYQSLRIHEPNAVLHVLCLDDKAYDYLKAAQLDGLRPISLDALEQWDPSLAAVQPTRSRIEYYFTTTASLVLYVMEQVAAVDAVTYLDADLFFFGDPAPIYEEIGTGSIGMFEHRFTADQAEHERWGRYNVGFLFFRNDSEGRRCLQWWRERCIEWCFDRFEEGKFADQKYLEAWPTLFRGVVVIEHPGAGLAPWNQGRYEISERNGRVYSGDVPLIFYHFHGVRVARRFFATHGLASYERRMRPAVMRHVYAPYIREIRRAQRKVGAGPGGGVRHSRRNGVVDIARSHERLIVQVGPLAFETQLDPILEPLLRLARLARSVVPQAVKRTPST